MEYLFALLILVVIWQFTTIFTGLLGLFVPILYALLGFILGTESLMLGIGGLFGSLLCLLTTNKYIKTQGAMSQAPFQSKISATAYIIVFSITIIANYILELGLKNINYWYLFLFAFILGLTLKYYVYNKGKANYKRVQNFKNSVLKYNILEKYNDDPKWATYLYHKNGIEGWNETIPGSFRAKDPLNDLTFVFDTKEEALNYAKSAFPNAKFIDN